MSNLRHLSEDDLRRAEIATAKRLQKLKEQVSGQTERLKWIRIYLDAAAQRRLSGVGK